MSKIILNNVSKIFERNGQIFKSLEDLDLEIYEKEFLCILGPSGCGKSTILRIIAGLDEPSIGEILVDDQKIEGPDSTRGMVFQEYSLFPWRSVVENVAFPLEMRGMDKERYEIAEDYLKIVGLEKFKDSMPQELSGGMKQRISIIRALAGDPNILLMDEPFGALDVLTRNQIQIDLLKIWKEKRKTIVFVTHSIDEAIFLGDRVILMSKGPGKIIKSFNVDIKRIRDRMGSDFLSIKKEIMELLTNSI